MFELTEEQLALKAMCRKWADEVVRPHAGAWSRAGGIPNEVFRQMGDLGLMGMLVPEAYGGADAGFVAYVAVMEEIGAADQSLAAAWNAHTTIGTLPIVRFGTEEQKQRWLVPLAEGRALGAFGLTEPDAGSDAAAVRTRAVRDGDGWRIDGSKMFISNAGSDLAQGVVLLASLGTDAGGRRTYATFFVPDGTPGYAKGARLDKLGWHALDTRPLHFDACWVPDDHLIGTPGEGLRQFLSVLDGGRISIAALAVSLAQGALALAIEHATNRVQFGKSISSFQATRQKVGQLAAEIEAARWLTYRAAGLADAGKEYGREAAMAKLFASQVANRVASEAVQIHGGYGWMAESDVARFYADAKILEIGEGTNEIQRDVVARSIGCR